MKLRRRSHAFRSEQLLDHRLRDIATSLDNATQQHVAEHALLETQHLLTRKVEIDMHNDDFETVITEPDPIVDRRGQRKSAVAKMGVGALVGALATSGAFLATRSSSPQAEGKNGDTVKTASEPRTPLYLKPAKVPAGLCLWNAMTHDDMVADMSDSGMPEQTLLTRGEERISVSATQMQGFQPPMLTGETVDINGSAGMLSSQDSGRVLSWTKGRTNIHMMGKGVPGETLLQVARSIQLSFDEFGVHIAALEAPGFERSGADLRGAVPDSSLNYGECNMKTPPNGPMKNLSVGASPNVENPMSPFMGDMQEKVTEVKLKRNGKTIDAKKRSQKSSNYSFEGYEWLEAGSKVYVGGSKLEDNVLLEVVESLESVSLAEFRKLAETATPPDFGGNMGPNGQQRTEDRSLGKITIGKRTVEVRSSTSGDQLCVSIRIGGSMMSGANCFDPEKEPKFANNFGGTSFTVAQAVADLSVVKAVATLPDGSTKELPSFQDDRVPNARVFVFARDEKDPTPTKIEFLDGSGKVVSSQ